MARILRWVSLSGLLAALMLPAPPARGDGMSWALVARWRGTPDPPWHLLVDRDADLGGVGLCPSGDDVLVVERDRRQIAILNKVGEQQATVPLTALAYPGAPEDVVGLADGTVAVSFPDDSRVVQVDRDGNLVAEWAVSSPRGLAESRGTLLVVSEVDRSVVELTADGTVGRRMALPADVVGPTGLDLIPSSDWTRPEAFTLLVVDRPTARVLALDALTGTATELFRLQGLRSAAAWGETTVVGVDGRGLMARTSGGELSAPLPVDLVNDIEVVRQGRTFASLTSGKVAILGSPLDLILWQGFLSQPWAVASDAVPVVADELAVHIWNQQGHFTHKHSIGAVLNLDVGVARHHPYRAAPGFGVDRLDDDSGGAMLHPADGKSGRWPILVAGRGDAVFIADLGRQEIARFGVPDGPEEAHWSFAEGRAFVDLRDIATNGPEVAALGIDGRVRIWSASGDARETMVVSPEAMRMALGTTGDVLLLDRLGWIHHMTRDGSVVERFSARLGSTIPIDLSLDAADQLLVADPSGEVRVYQRRPAPGGAVPTPFPADSCAVRADKSAMPSRVFLGDTVEIDLALAGPCRTASPSDVVVAVDRIGQHGYDHIEKDVAVRVVAAASSIPGARVGVVIGGHDGGRVLSELTSDAARVAEALLHGYPDFQLDHSASIWAALHQADELLRADPAVGPSPAVVLIADSPTQAGWLGQPDPAPLAAELRGRGVRIIPVDTWNVDNPEYEALGGPGTIGLGLYVPWEAPRLARAILARLRDAETEPWQHVVIEDRVPANMEYVAGSAQPPVAYDETARRLVWSFDAPIARGTSIRYELRPRETGTWPTNVRAWADYSAPEGDGTIEFPVPWIEVLEPVLPSPTPSPTPTRTPPATATASPTESPVATATSTAEPTASSTAEPTATATPTVTPSASASATPSLIPSPTATHTPAPTITPVPTTPIAAPLYLPVALREFCPPKDLYLDVVLVIDASTSMRDLTTVGRSKLEVAKESAALFLGGLRLRPGEDRAAIVTFNAGAETLQSLTADRAALDNALRRIRLAEQSRVDLGVARAMVELIARGRPDHLEAMVVLSDGLANPVPGDEAIAAARRAQLEGITLYVVGMGPAMDERVLRAMASGAARYFAAPDPDAIPAIYRDLTRHVACPPELFWGRR